MRFKGKSVLITGGTSGLGENVAIAFAKEGANILFCGLIDSDGARVTAILKEMGAKAYYTHADVREERAMEALVSEACDHFGGLDIAFNNAGISHKAARFAHMPVATAREVFDTNVMGVWHAMRYQIPVMLAAGSGAIINTASILSKSGAEWMTAYGMSKHALIGMTKSAALDYAGTGLRINAISPGPMLTPMLTRALDDIGGDMSKFAGGFPKGGPADPMDVAQTVLYLASDDARTITGANFIVDGGVSQG